MKLIEFNPLIDGEHTKKLAYRPTSAHWENVSKWFAVLILAVFPLLNGSDRYYNITESKYFYLNIFEFGYIGICGFIMLSYILDKSLREKRFSGGKQKLNLSQIFIIGYFISGCVSSILSEYSSQTFLGITRFEGLISIFLYSIIFVFLAFWGEYHDLYLWAASIMTVIFAIISVLELTGIDFVSPEGINYNNHHFVGTIGNVDMVSGFAAIVIPLCALSYIFLEGKFRYFSAVGLILMIYLQLFIDVDSGKMGLLAASAFSVPYMFINKKTAVRSINVISMIALSFGLNKIVIPKITEVGFEKSKTGFILIGAAVLLAAVSYFLNKSKIEFTFSEKKIVIIMAVIVIIAIIGAFIWLYGYEGDNRLLYEASQVLHGNLEDNFGSNRGYIWKNTWKEALKNPIFGGGPGVFAKLYTLNETQGNHITDFAHNDFLQILTCQGFVGMIFYLGFIISMAIKGIKNSLNNKVVIIFMVSCLSYLVHSFFSFSIAIITPLFWVLAGLMDKCIRQSNEYEIIGEMTPGKAKEKRQKAK